MFGGGGLTALTVAPLVLRGVPLVLWLPFAARSPFFLHYYSRVIARAAPLCLASRRGGARHGGVGGLFFFLSNSEINEKVRVVIIAKARGNFVFNGPSERFGGELGATETKEGESREQHGTHLS